MPLMWMILTPREAELIDKPTLIGQTEQAELLRRIRAGVTRGAIDAELTVADGDVNKCTVYAGHYRSPYAKAFAAVVTAAARHA